MVYDHTTTPDEGRLIRILAVHRDDRDPLPEGPVRVTLIGGRHGAPYVNLYYSSKAEDRKDWLAYVTRWEYADEAPEPPPANAVIEEVASAVTRGNPKDVIGSTKASLATVFWPAIYELGLAMLEGECKYWRHNYLAAPVRATVYLDALHRHIAKWVMGEEIDPESEAGLTHLAKAAACVHILQAARAYGTLIDDRPPRMPDGWLDTLSGQAKTVIDKLGQQYVRGAYTEAERARWPEFNEALSKGPIRKDGGK